MRYSTRLAVLIGLISIFIIVLLIDFSVREHFFIQSLEGRNRFQRMVTLPNLGTTTAARYLRHYSLTDLSAPFQDYPGSQEHFPASFAYTPPDFSNMPSRIVNRPGLAVKR